MSKLDSTIHRKQAVANMIDCLHQTVDNKCPDMPDHWSEQEIKQYIIDVAKALFSPHSTLGRVLKGQRAKDYDNDVITRGL